MTPPNACIALLPLAGGLYFLAGVVCPENRAVRWGRNGHGPPMSRFGNAAWASLFFWMLLAWQPAASSEMELYGLALLAIFALMICAGLVDSVLERRREDS